jgi:microcystin degradation protein MlrC
MRRIGILEILQESNSMNPVRTERADFERFGVAAGAEVLARYGEVGTLAGFLRGMAAWQEKAEPVGLVRLHTWPCGPLSSETLAWILALLRTQLRAAGRLDGLLCSLHGSMVGEGEDDVEGAVLGVVREALGPAVPVVATLDLHAFVTPRMVELASALVAYHTSPHIDQVQTGVRAAGVLRRIHAGARPRSGTRRIPMISIAEAQSTALDPLKPIYERVVSLEQEPGVLSSAVLMTQGWLDLPGLGWSTLVVTDGDEERAGRIADELADACWAVRERLTEDFLSARESVDAAIAHRGAPVVIADGADATNSGAGGDSVHLLEEFLTRDIPGGALTIMVDREAVAEAMRVGEGGAFRFAVGGKRDRIFSKPLPVSGKVERIAPARYVLSGHGGHNLPVDMGRSAVVRLRDVTLLLVESPGPGSTPLMYRCVGLEPRAYKIVVVKSPAGFRAEYGPLASLIILADCPGCASPRYERLPYRRISRPLWPLDEIPDWRRVPWMDSGGSR